MKCPEKCSDYAYALLRIMAGFMFSFHGIQKILGILAEFQPPVGSQLWFGGIIELIGGLAILLGFQTRVAAFLCSGEMAVAYFQFHWKFQFGAAFFPGVNKGELAVLYCFVFLFMAAHGSGIWSLYTASLIHSHIRPTLGQFRAESCANIYDAVYRCADLGQTRWA
jgi:putative oxidoreductase